MNNNVIAISRFQGNIEWEKVKAEGISMAFSRLGEGEIYIDPTFSKNPELHVSLPAPSIYFEQNQALRKYKPEP